MPPTTNGAVGNKLTPVNMSQKSTTVVTENLRQYSSDDESSPSTSWTPVQMSNMNKESERLKTFDQWPVSFLAPRTMTAAGFYYLKREDIVRCAFCGVEVGRWVQGDDPLADHRKWSPSCRFIKRLDVGNIPLAADGENGLQTIQVENGFDTCGPYVNGNISATAQCAISPTTILEKHIGYQKSRDPAYPQYNSYSSRLNTYETWPISLKLKPNVLSDAGFFYTGKSDQTICFQCGGGLKDWEETDEPWIEHARWFSKCLYVLMVKGKDYIDQVSGNKIVQNAESEVESQSAQVLEKDCSTSKETITSCDDESTSPVQSTGGEGNDGRLCKICYIEEMGVVFLPCGHIVACVKCAISLRSCAVCRKQVTATFRAFLS